MFIETPCIVQYRVGHKGCDFIDDPKLLKSRYFCLNLKYDPYRSLKIILNKAVNSCNAKICENEINFDILNLFFYFCLYL